MPTVKANFEHILLPYAPIADFTGRSWPRSMSQPAILSAVKLFMGLEERRDMMISGRDSCGIWIDMRSFASTEYSQEVFDQMAIDNIKGGYPIVVIPHEYEETILATGYSDQGRNLRGISFLDGDDEKNSIMCSYKTWYENRFNY